MYPPIEGGYEPAEPIREHEPLIEDKQSRNFYGPICQFGYPFAVKIKEQ